MEVLSGSINKQQKVKNVFKQLLERVAFKRNIPRKPANYSYLKSKQQKNIRSRSLTVPPDFDKSSLATNAIFSQGSSLKITRFNQKKLTGNHRRNLSIKGSVSNRFHSQNKAEDHLVDSKIRQYNQLLITKSYIFSEFQNRKTKTSKHNKTQMCNFQKKQKGTVRQFKKIRLVRKTLPDIGQEELLRHKTECFDRGNSFHFEPWDTDIVSDFY